MTAAIIINTKSHSHGLF